MKIRNVFAALASAFSLVLSAHAADPANLRFPTENKFLLEGQPERFFMYCERNFEGQESKPWEAGSFGFVRTPIRVNNEVLCVKFHEGIDIAPMARDAAGNPLDDVCSIADGTVAYVSSVAGHSNYGRYVVIEHRWDQSSVYSLYAHLNTISCQVGQAVQAGTPLGKLGFTGAGINRTRAHVHLEIGLLMSQRYEDWHRTFGGGTNHHGLFNGMNLIGADAAKFYLDRKANPALGFADYIATIPAYFKVAVPNHTNWDFAKRYPWLVKGAPSTSWEISFSATGLPLAITPSARAVTTPLITAVRNSEVPHRYLTRGLLTGTGPQAALTDSGKKLIALLTDDFPVAPPPAAASDPKRSTSSLR